MRQKLGGSEIDVLSTKDLQEAVKGWQQWMVDVARGVRPIRFNAQGDSDANGLIQVGGAVTLTGGRLGPDDGYSWAVCRLAVRVDGEPGAFSLYVGGAHTNSLIRDVTGDANGYVGFGAQECLLIGGEQLYLRASSEHLSTKNVCTVSGAAIEIPNQLMWKWLAG